MSASHDAFTARPGLQYVQTKSPASSEGAIICVVKQPTGRNNAVCDSRKRDNLPALDAANRMLFRKVVRRFAIWTESTLRLHCPGQFSRENYLHE